MHISENQIYCDTLLRKSCIKEGIITDSEITWIADELRKNGSRIQRRFLVDIYRLAHFVPVRFKEEIEFFETYLKAKRTLIRKISKDENLVRINSRTKRPYVQLPKGD